MKKRYLLLPLAVFLGLAAFLAVGLNRNPRELPSPLVGKPAPAFAAARLGAPAASFRPADLRGQVWLLNVWASWCGACRVEHPVLLRLAQSGLAPVVGLDYKDQDGAGLQWLRTQGDPYLLSIADRDGRIGMDYGVYGVPETFVIDRQGVIRLRHAGPLTQDLVDRRIAPLIRELNNG